MITTNNTLFKNRNIRKNIDLPKLRDISQIDKIIDTKVDILFTNIKNKYSISEDEVYDRLYLKVRKMFLEEEN